MDNYYFVLSLHDAKCLTYIISNNSQNIHDKGYLSSFFRFKGRYKRLNSMVKLRFINNISISKVITPDSTAFSQKIYIEKTILSQFISIG